MLLPYFARSHTHTDTTTARSLEFSSSATLNTLSVSAGNDRRCKRNVWTCTEFSQSFAIARIQAVRNITGVQRRGRHDNRSLQLHSDTGGGRTWFHRSYRLCVPHRCLLSWAIGRQCYITLIVVRVHNRTIRLEEDCRHHHRQTLQYNLKRMKIECILFSLENNNNNRYKSIHCNKVASLLNAQFILFCVLWMNTTEIHIRIVCASLIVYCLSFSCVNCFREISTVAWLVLHASRLYSVIAVLWAAVNLHMRREKRALDIITTSENLLIYSFIHSIAEWTSVIVNWNCRANPSLAIYPYRTNHWY